MEGISVVICCYNSAARLPSTLAHLFNQKIEEKIQWEVVIVDNNSTDSTCHTAREIWQEASTSVPMIIVSEPRPGLSHARLKGIASSSFDFVILCDDDNWLSEQFVQRAFFLMKKGSQFGAIGGMSEAAFEDDCEVPPWFEQYKNGYAVGRQAEISSDVTVRGFLWGAGLVLRRQLCLKVFNSRFPLLLPDRVGGKLVSGGDSEICLRLIIAGYRLYYDEDLRFRHFIPVNRLTEDYRDELYMGFEDSMKILRKYYYFIKHFCPPNRAGLKEIKWRVVYWLNKLGLLDRSDFSNRMLSIFTPYKLEKLDAELRYIRKFADSIKKNTA